MKGRFDWMSLLPVLLLIIVIAYEKFFRQKRIRSEYDEMQLELRGRGAWYGFYVSVLYFGGLFLLENLSGFRFLTASNAVFLGVMISGSVIVGYSILHDSYYGMNRSNSRNYPFLAVISGIEVCCVICLVSLIREGLFRDLSIPCEDSRLMIVLCIPLFTTILVTTLIRHLKPEEEEA